MNMICKNVGNDEKSGIYLFQSDQHNNRLYIDAFQIYKYLTNSSPKPQYLLFCNNETTNEELTAFLYRSIFCEFQSCFIIIGLDFLSPKKKSFFLNLLKELYISDKNRKI